MNSEDPSYWWCCNSFLSWRNIISCGLFKISWPKLTVTLAFSSLRKEIICETA
jgi:hypothetical protein